MSQSIKAHGINGQRIGLYKAVLLPELVPYYSHLQPEQVLLCHQTHEYHILNLRPMRLPTVLFNLSPEDHQQVHTRQLQANQSFALPEATLILQSTAITQLPIQARASALIGFTIYNYDQVIGPIHSYYVAQQPLLCVKKNQQEILIPLHDAFIKKVNWLDQTLHMELPDGLIELTNG